MSARIVVNLESRPASFAIDHGSDAGTWLSLWGDREIVMVKLSAASLRELGLALARELRLAAGDAATSGAASDAVAPVETPTPRPESGALASFPAEPPFAPQIPGRS